MANKQITDYPDAGGIDAAADEFLLWQNSTNTYRKITRNVILGSTGTPVTTTASQTLQNKTLDNTNTITLKDTLFTLQDDGDTTKQARFQLSGITTATTRTYTLPNASSTIADISTSQTLTNKTLTSPVISGGTIDNSTITVDSISGHTTANSGTIYGISVTSGTIAAAALASNSVTTAKIAAGAVTSTKITLSYGFSAYSTVAQNSGNAAFAKTNFATTEYDIGANYNTGTSTFTAPVAGYYHFDAAVEANTNTTIWIISLFKNGSEWKRGTDLRFASQSAGGVVGADAKLTAGDTMDVRIFGNASIGITVTQASCYFMGHFIGN